jgi:excinuclease UvrABC nuclease subunit
MSENDYEEINKEFSNISNIQEINSNYIEEKSYVYAIFDDKNNLLYVGQTQSIEQRFKAHKKAIQGAAICRYIEVDKEKVNDTEFYFISKFLPRYNKILSQSKSYLSLDQAQSIDQRFYSLRVKILRIIREKNIKDLGGFYHVDDLDIIVSLLGEVEE